MQSTFAIVSIHIVAFATICHQGWASRTDRPAFSRVHVSLLSAKPAGETVMVMPGESAP